MDQKQDRTHGRFADTLEVGGKRYTYFPVSRVPGVEKLPYSLTVLLENVLRNAATDDEAELMARRIVEAGCAGQVGEEVEFSPARVLFQDFTGVPVFVDFAAMREGCKNLGGDPKRINPQIPCNLVIDHSVIADSSGEAASMDANLKLEFERNEERYRFLRWAQGSFDNVGITPPATGICHQLNVEKIAQVVGASEEAGNDVPTACFDTVVGTDSHTPTVNGIGVLGWGVGGIEAEAAALGQPITTLVPRVVGVHVTGACRPGVAAMDVSLTFAEMLRAKGVVGCFVECFGAGLGSLSATARACIANMSPEYGCTCTLFPVDARTCDFLELTGRPAEQRALVEAYAKAQGFWHDPAAAPRVYAEVIEFDLGAVEPSIAGPSRPHDRIPLSAAKERFRALCVERRLNLDARVEIDLGDGCFEATPGARMCTTAHGCADLCGAAEVGQGAIAIAAITSCTTTADPAMMVTAGLLARKARAAGLLPKPWVKCILAPGSQSAYGLLEGAGLLDDLAALSFASCGFGCMSCIGNSGSIIPALRETTDRLELASVLSGNRNFEGRISPDVSQNYLMAPALVVAYALAGTVDVDFACEPLGENAEGAPVFLRDIWPDEAEVDAMVAAQVDAELYRTDAMAAKRAEKWDVLGSASSDLFAWDDASTYVRHAPYFDGVARTAAAPEPVRDARVLALLGDFITTDHISPAGSIAADSPAARYLEERGVALADFNTYGSRRGNHEVMARGTFANVKLRNVLADGRRGGWTRNFLTDEIDTIYDTACAYTEAGDAMVVIAGKMYGSGSSRDWAAKGPMLLGVRAVIAESFERIHRSNLIGMGILPLQFAVGQNAETLGLDGSERISVGEIDFSAGLPNPQVVRVTARKADGTEVAFDATVRIDTPTEGSYFANGGILQYVLRQLS
ncbi:MAG TPA: aconitate hydratase AcnA [Candidatus Aphodovivens avistercoris]|nr:aconitate hydratase AcnA [Candidatus Aphodovivens avistercoris]